MKNIIKIILSIALLFTVSVVVAQKHIEKTKTVCDTDTRPLNLGEDVIGINLTPTGGTWVEVDAKDHTKIIKNDVTNIFVAIDRHPGVYVFIYTAKNNVCMTNGDTAKAIITVQETPKPLHINIALCPGETKNINLNNYVSTSLKDIQFKDSKGTVLTNGTLPITATFEGIGIASYQITTAGFICNPKASITYNVTRDGTISSKNLSGGKSLCVSALPASINLNKELGLGGNGAWTTAGTAPAVTNGVVSFSGSVATGTHTYKYTFSGGTCGLDGTVGTYTLTITDDLSSEFKDGNLNVCKIRNPKRRVDMMSALNINVPVNAGEWTAEAGNPQDVAVADGYFNVENAVPGTYRYKFKVSNAVDLCGLTGKEAILSLILENGGRLMDGEVQICNINAPKSLKLSKYVAGIASSNVSWYGSRGVTKITSGEIDASALSVGTHRYVYKTDLSDCPYEGSLYITVIKDKELTNFIDKTIAYCYTDEGSDAIDLDEILGVAGVPGKWTTTVTGANYNTTSHVFNGKAEAAKTGKYPQKFIFTFTADNTASCGLAGKSATITVNITDTLIP